MVSAASSPLIYFSHFCSLVFHTTMGMLYIIQPPLPGSALTDPVGFLTLSNLFSTGAPCSPANMFTNVMLTRIYLRLVGMVLLYIAGNIFYELNQIGEFYNSSTYGFFHFIYMIIAIAGLRNHWNTPDVLVPWFAFHLILLLGLFKLKRVKITEPIVTSDDDEVEDDDYVPPLENLSDDEDEEEEDAGGSDEKIGQSSDE